MYICVDNISVCICVDNISVCICVDNISVCICVLIISVCVYVLIISVCVSGGSRMGHLGQMPPPFKKLHTRSRYSNRAVNYSNKAVTMFMRQCSLPMKL